MYDDLKIIFYPDPRLKKISPPVTVFDENLTALATRMLALMHGSRGVGLAAPQLGINQRLFVMCATGKPEDDKVFVNPVLSDAAGDAEDDEGCLSLPEIRAKILRSLTLRIDAVDLKGVPFSQVAEGYMSRIWQHEVDHLNGTLILDRMGMVARLGARKQLKELEARYLDQQGKK